jgi:hydroxymethylpyrimidine pyrophosphatase-like HAD family hydrolase
MRKYKMICLDIDGTLLNSRNQITENTKEIIHTVVNEKQIPVILVSQGCLRVYCFYRKN